MNPTTMAEKPTFPPNRSNASDGEPDAVKVARPVRREGWRRPAGAIWLSAALSLLYLADRLGVSEGAVRKLTNPDHRSHMSQVHKALKAVGRSLKVEITAA